LSGAFTRLEGWPDTIPDHVGQEAVRLLNNDFGSELFQWPTHREHASVITVAKLLMNPPAPMTDPDEEAAKRVLKAMGARPIIGSNQLALFTEQMRKEREAWEAGR
jgi:hypothetical protein